MAACIQEDLARCIIYIYNVLLFITGLACIAIGLWMNTDTYVVSYFVVLKRGFTDDALLAASALLLTAGLLIILVGIMGCYGVVEHNVCVIKWYVFLLVIIMILELTAGFLVVVFEDGIHKKLKSGMREQIQGEYQPDTKEGDAWDFIQVRIKCCGVDGSMDYAHSNWWYGMNPGVEDDQAAKWWVPNSCCVLDFNQDRDVREVDPEDAIPRDVTKCQQHAQGNIDTGEYLHKRGCFVALLDFIYKHLNTIIGLGLAVGLLQLVGLIFACMYLCAIRDDEVDVRRQPHGVSAKY